MSELIEVPSADGIAEAYALAQRWLPAFLAGRRADDDVYAEDVATWHNTSETVSKIQQTPSRTRANAAGADLRLENPRIKVFDGGWVFQATTVGATADGDPVRIPSCLVVTVENGRIARFEEYADSRAVEVLFG